MKEGLNVDERELELSVRSLLERLEGYANSFTPLMTFLREIEPFLVEVGAVFSTLPHYGENALRLFDREFSRTKSVPSAVNAVDKKFRGFKAEVEEKKEQVERIIEEWLAKESSFRSYVGQSIFDPLFGGLEHPESIRDLSFEELYARGRECLQLLDVRRLNEVAAEMAPQSIAQFFQEVTSGLRELLFSGLSRETLEIMSVLATVITTLSDLFENFVDSVMYLLRVVDNFVETMKKIEEEPTLGQILGYGRADIEDIRKVRTLIMSFDAIFAAFWQIRDLKIPDDNFPKGFWNYIEGLRDDYEELRVRLYEVSSIKEIIKNTKLFEEVASIHRELSAILETLEKVMETLPNKEKKQNLETLITSMDENLKSIRQSFLEEGRELLLKAFLNLREALRKFDPLFDEWN